VLALASAFDPSKTVAMLLEAGADAAQKLDADDTPLHVFLREGCISWDEEECEALAVVTMLVEAGADPLAANEPGETPLHLAAGVRHEEVISYLIEKEVDINAENMDGWTPLDYAHETPYEKAGSKPSMTPPDRKAAAIALLEKHGAKKGKSAK
jgi:ankyrin repeat protein